jgi:hypothetical protein
MGLSYFPDIVVNVWMKKRVNHKSQPCHVTNYIDFDDVATQLQHNTLYEMII